MFLPAFAMAAVGGVLPSVFQPLSIVGMPGGVLYGMFRDSFGKGTSLGKRWLGLRLIDVHTGVQCSGRRVWARNLLDLIPIVNLIDFTLMCLDARGQKMMDKALKTQLIER
jgi:uncharacterized RDD family membrane protein YckC